MFKTRLKNIVDNSKYNTVTLASALGVSQPTISRYLAGIKLPTANRMNQIINLLEEENISDETINDLVFWWYQELNDNQQLKNRFHIAVEKNHFAGFSLQEKSLVKLFRLLSEDDQKELILHATSLIK